MIVWSLQKGAWEFGGSEILSVRLRDGWRGRQGGRGWSQETVVQEYTYARKKKGRKPELAECQGKTGERKGALRLD